MKEKKKEEKSLGLFKKKNKEEKPKLDDKFKTNKEKKPGLFSKLFSKKPKSETSKESLKEEKPKEKNKTDILEEKINRLKESINEEKEDIQSDFDKVTKSKSKEELKKELKQARDEKEKEEFSKETINGDEPELKVKEKRSFIANLIGKKKELTEIKEKDIRILFKKKIEEKHKKISASERKRRLTEYLEKSGLNFDQQKLAKVIFYIAVGITGLLTIVYVYLNVINWGSIIGIFGQTLILWILGFVTIWGTIWIVFRIYLDLLIFRRKLSVEEVLPDFLQLTSANLRAGMPIDRALWFAVRPRFGVLSREIEDTAKRTLAGQPLNEALLIFAKKYDSQILLRSIYLLNEGMEAGGDVGELLNKIAVNITEMRGIKKEMAANVTTYVIFISFASMIAAPALFGLSSELLKIVQSIATDVAGAGGGSMGGAGLSINISNDTIKLSHYNIFAYVCLSVSSVFSAIIVATIKKGNIKEGLQYIPIFVVVSVTIYFITSKLLGLMLGGLF